MLDRVYASPDAVALKAAIAEMEADKEMAQRLFFIEPITASDQEIHLHVIIPACCKPDQVEAVARDVARSLHYSVGGGVKVGWIQTMGPDAIEAVDVTFAASAHRDHAVSP